MEGEVAQNVAEALKVQLTSSEVARIDSVPTQNAAAYDLFLQANTRANHAYDLQDVGVADLDSAISLYQQALARDPDFALAWAGLARAHMYKYFQGLDRTNARLAEAKAAADRALALQPNLGEGHYALALYHYWGHRDYAAALTQLAQARVALPNSATIELTIGWIARREGRWNEAEALFHTATVLDPNNGVAFDNLAGIYQPMRRYAEADRARATAIALTTRYATRWRIERAETELLWKGDLAPLRTELAALAPGSDAYVNLADYIFWERWLARDYAGAILAGESDKAETWADGDGVNLPRRLMIAWALQAAGDRVKATTAYSGVEARTRVALAERPDDANLHLALGYACAGLGKKAEAVVEGERAAALMPVAKDALTGPDMLGHLAELYVRVGQPEKAIALIGRVMTMPNGDELSPAMLRIDPVWDPLRGDPRFKALLLKYPISG